MLNCIMVQNNEVYKQVRVNSDTFNLSTCPVDNGIKLIDFTLRSTRGTSRMLIIPTIQLSALCLGHHL